MASKIDEIRNELERIASVSDRQDHFAPTMRASWSFGKVAIIGKLAMQTFDYEEVRFLLRRIASGAGEVAFWNLIESVRLSKSRAQNSQCQVIALRDYQCRA